MRFIYDLLLLTLAGLVAADFIRHDTVFTRNTLSNLEARKLRSMPRNGLSTRSAEPDRGRSGPPQVASSKPSLARTGSVKRKQSEGVQSVQPSQRQRTSEQAAKREGSPGKPPLAPGTKQRIAASLRQSQNLNNKIKLKIAEEHGRDQRQLAMVMRKKEEAAPKVRRPAIIPPYRSQVIPQTFGQMIPV